jgi:site-specific DNA recombinase
VSLGYRPLDKKLVVVPDEAAIVRLMFERYLALRSVRALADELAERGIVPRRRARAATRGEDKLDWRGRFLVGPLAHILKNRCYVGDVVYRNEVYAGEHEPIIERKQFEAVQECLSEGAVRHKRARIDGSTTAPLTGLLFNELGDRMTPCHANKKGVRYRYYVSQALLQSAERQMESVGRVSGPEVEQLLVQAVRHRWVARRDEGGQLSDRELLTAMVDRVVLYRDRIEVNPRAVAGREGSVTEVDDQDHGSGTTEQQCGNVPSSERSSILIPWRKSGHGARRGIASEPEGPVTMDPRIRETLLRAIARARAWMAEIMNGGEITFAAIADREGKGERHIRLLAPLAFVSPRVIAAIVDGVIQREVTVTSLAKQLPLSWTAQEKALGVG